MCVCVPACKSACACVRACKSACARACVYSSEGTTWITWMVCVCVFSQVKAQHG